MSLAADMPVSLTNLPPQPDPAEEIKLLAELLSVMTHDLRSPIGAIGIFCELLLGSEKPLDESQTRSVEMIAEAAAKAQQILEDAADVGRIYRGTLTLASEPVDLRDVVGEALSQVRPVAEKRGVQVAFDFEPGDYTVAADPGRLWQIVLRLCEEAVASSPKEAEVTMRGTVTGSGELVVSFSRPANDDPGERVRRDTDTSLKGRLANRKPGESHYSLYLASRVAAFMGGALDYDSVGPFRATLRFPAFQR